MSYAISLDSIINLPAMGIPVVNYSPESTWEFGAAAQGYFRLPNQERTSIVQDTAVDCVEICKCEDIFFVLLEELSSLSSLESLKLL
jgi:hypothetical protein